MKAVRIHHYGGREVLTYEDAPCPEVDAGQVQVRVAATSVNPFDWAARSGYVSTYYTYSFPHTLGLDVAGVIDDIGPGVEGFSLGEKVYGRAHPINNGAYAQFMVLSASQVARKPETLDLIESAGVPHVGVSAWKAVVETASIGAGQTLLIHGAAGGVGTIAVQLAKLRGAQVIGTSSANNQEYVRSLGADETIDYNRTRFEEVVGEVDAVLDLVGDMGDNTQTRSWQVIKPGGLLMSLVQFPQPPESAREQGIRSVMVAAEICDTGTLDELRKLIDGGKLHTVVSTVFPLKEVQQAHALSEGRHVRGKIVMTVGED